MRKQFSNKISTPKEDKVLYIIVSIVLSILTLITLYPVLYIVSASFSDPDAISTGKVILFPVGFSLQGYEKVFSDSRVYTGFYNSFINTSIGTLINISMTILAAYPLSRKDLFGKSFVLKMFTFTMLVSAGIIPNYILMRDLGLLNSRWSLLLLGAITAYNMIIARTFFSNEHSIRPFRIRTNRRMF